MKAVVIQEHGGPEVLRVEEVDAPHPGPGEVVVEHEAIALNYIDTYHRSGLYPNTLPHGLGVEAAGRIVARGEGVTSLASGDRVAYVIGSPGSYAERRAVPAERVVRLPDSVSFERAATLMIKGLTAWYLLEEMWPLEAGQHVLIHAAAGGTGSLLVPWARHLGLKVIGTAGSKEKLERATALGCHHVIAYQNEDVGTRVRELTGGQGVDLVLDGVGAATFEGSLASLRVRGLLASFGNASGPVPAFEPARLAAAGSVFLTRPSLFHYIASAAELRRGAERVFQLVGDGVIAAEEPTVYRLDDVAEAHRDLEARRTLGGVVLRP